MKTTISAALVLACFSAQAQTDPAPQRAALGAPGGRFVFGQVSDFRRDQYLLDTQTGRLWQKVCAAVNKQNPPNCDITIMQPMDFVDDNGKPIGSTPPQGR